MTATETIQNYELLDPDVRLMLRVKEDDAAAFEELVARYQHRIASILYHMVHRPDQVEDLAQDVFLRVYRARKSYRPSAKFATWLFHIVHNVGSSARLKQARRREVIPGPRANSDEDGLRLEEIALAASGAMPTRLLDKAERAEMVRRAIDALNDRQRMALLLSRFEGMSYEEIAEAMGLTIQATKSLLSRARESLRVILEPYMEEGRRTTGDASP